VFTGKPLYIQKWLKKWRIRVNGAKSVQVTFTTRREACPPVTLNGLKIPQTEDAKYLGLLDRRLNWKKHISTKRKLGIELNKMYCYCSAANRNCRSKINCCCTRQSLNLWRSTLGHSLLLKYRNTRKISKQISQNHCQRTLIRHQ